MLSSHVNSQNIANLYHLSQTGQSWVPVSAKVAMFSNFSHINGVSANSRNAVEVSVTQLHVINQLIQHQYEQQQKAELSRELEQQAAIAGKADATARLTARLATRSHKLGLQPQHSSVRVAAGSVKQKGAWEVLRDQGAIFDIVV